MKKKGIGLRAASLVLAALGLAMPSWAAGSRVAVTPKASTLGLGADVSVRLTPRVHLRLEGQGFDYERSEEVDDVPYDLELGLRSLGAIVDIHPRANSFHVSAGLLANGNEIDSAADLDPTQSYEIGGATFTGAELGGIDGSVDFDAAAPYLGIGWGNPFAREGRFGFSFALGVIRQGTPDVRLDATNPAADPLLDQELEAEAEEFEEDFEQLEYFPVVSVGLSIRL